ncbi:uncharacterized protein QC761_121110 [Podospora bellae-mahoneyi]|uniref:Uncharacterized protein n=1 Tax=Podospora bellae-mahoneyi TaxID=2093777 RepID=A0ABR0G1T6_9PEZI|nr:hypothetical protein QC761_121110 [Podospora bellae-mahoneyi]
MASYNPAYKPLPPPGNFQQGYLSAQQQHQHQQLQHQQHQQLQHHHQQHQQYLQQQQQQQQHRQHSGQNGIERPPSFVGLPPIRRGSSLGLNAERFSGDNNNNNNNNSPGSSNGHQQQQHQLQQYGQQHQQHSGTAQQNPNTSHQGQQHPQQQSIVQSVYRPTQGAPGPQTQAPTQGQQTWQLQGQGQQGPSPGLSRGFAGAAVNAPHGVPPQGPQQYTDGSGRQGPMLPHMLPGNLSQRFQPQSWVPQESHLAEPLHPSSRHRSSPSNASSQHQQQQQQAQQQQQQQQQPHQQPSPPQQQQQPYYGFDKETGGPVSGGQSSQRPKPQASQPSQQTHPAFRDQQHYNGLPSQRAHPTQPLPALPTIHQSPVIPQGSDQENQQQKNNVSPPGSGTPGITVTEDGRIKRNSGVYSGLRDRLATGGPVERRDGDGTPRYQGVGNDVVSDSSDDEGDLPNPIGPFGGRAADNDSMIAHGPGTPMGERVPPPPSQFAPPGRKLTTFFGIGATQPSGPQQPNSMRPDMSRTSTSTNATENQPAGSIGGPPKKRFSALKNVFHRSEGHKHSPSFTIKTSPPQAQAQFQGMNQGPPPASFLQGPPPGPLPGIPQGEVPRTPQGPVQGQFQGQSPGQIQGQAQGQGQHPQGPTPPAGAGPQPGSFNLYSGPERTVTGLRQPGHALPPPGAQDQQSPQQQQGQRQQQAQQQQQGSFAQYDQTRKPSGGMFGFLRNRADSKPKDGPPAVSLPIPPGQPIPFSPGRGGQQQYGMSPALGPDGRPSTAANQQLFQSQFGRGGPGSPGQTLPVSQPSDNGQLDDEFIAHRPPPLPQQSQSQLSFQHGQAENLSTVSRQQEQETTPYLQNAQLHQPTKLLDPTPAGSAFESPVSSKSQPVSQAAVEQGRHLNDSPASFTVQQAVAVRQPPAQSYGQGSRFSPTQNPTRKPLNASEGLNNDQSAPPGSPPAGYQGQGPTQFGVSGPSFQQETRGAGPSPFHPSAGVQLPDQDSRAPSRQSISAVSPTVETPSIHMHPQGLSQGPGAGPRPPSGHSYQSSLQSSQVQQGQAPLQGISTQPTWGSAQSGPQPNRAPFGPGPRPNGNPVIPQFHQKEKEQSTISKLFKGSKATGPSAPKPEKGEKEKGGNLSGFLGAFKKGTKQTEIHSPNALPPMGGQPFLAGQSSQGQKSQPFAPHQVGVQAQPQPQQQPPAGASTQEQRPQQTGPAGQHPYQNQPQFQRQQGTVPTVQPSPPSQQQDPRPGPPPTEPKYERVPIPASYGYVHGEGRVAPGPVGFYVGPTPIGLYGMPQGQMIPAGYPQQWVQPGGMPTQVPPGAVPGQVNSQQVNGAQGASPQPSNSSAPVNARDPSPASQGHVHVQAPSPVPVQPPAPPPASAAPALQQPPVFNSQPSLRERVPSPEAQPTQQTHPPQTAQPAQPPPPVQQPAQSHPASTLTAVPRQIEVSPQSSVRTAAPQAPSPNVSPPERQVQPRPEPARFDSRDSDTLPSAQPSPLKRKVSPPQNGSATHQRQFSAGNGLASLPSQQRYMQSKQSPSPPNGSQFLPPRSPDRQAPSTVVPIHIAGASIVSQGSRTVSPPQDSRTVSPEPIIQGPSAPVQHLQSPSRVPDDNIYDATPRNSQFAPQEQPKQQPESQQQQQQRASPPPQPQTPQQQEEQQRQSPVQTRSSPMEAENTIIISEPTETKSAGPSHDTTRPKLELKPPAEPRPRSNSPPAVDHDSDDDLSDVESPIIASATVATLKPASPSNKTTQTGAVARENIAIFERAKKKAEEERIAQERMVMEEKIPVFDDEMMNAGKKKEDEKVQMSATSYPGQEWNPYGEFQEWE